MLYQNTPFDSKRGHEMSFSVSETVALINQTLEFAYPTVTVVGELANFQVSKGKWVYADLKDDAAKLRCFGTVFQLPGPLEDGMMLEVVAEPRLHQLYGFSLNIRSLRPVGEGSIKKASDLLEAKLRKEGLFDPARKRPIPDKPTHIGVVASVESAAYADFVKVMEARWQDVSLDVFHAQVQGEQAPESLIAGIKYFNESAQPPEVIVMTRGRGSADDLAAFSHEQVTRAVAGSRIPTVVAVGHEIDVSLAELAADLRASTPSNAAELLFEQSENYLRYLHDQKRILSEMLQAELASREDTLQRNKEALANSVTSLLDEKAHQLSIQKTLLEAVHPNNVMKKGYAIVRANKKLVRSISDTSKNDKLAITVQDGTIDAKVE